MSPVLLPICTMQVIPFSASVYAALMKNHQLFAIRLKSQKLVYVDCMSRLLQASRLEAKIKIPGLLCVLECKER